jgi:hypothetical protein
LHSGTGEDLVQCICVAWYMCCVLLLTQYIVCPKPFVLVNSFKKF